MTESYIEKLARWSNTLNSWEWPPDLLGKPDGWDSMPNVCRDDEFIPNKYDWCHGVMEKIQRKIGRKEFLRWHHIHNIGRTNDEFELWWKEHYQ